MVSAVKGADGELAGGVDGHGDLNVLGGRVNVAEGELAHKLVLAGNVALTSCSTLSVIGTKNDQ